MKWTKEQFEAITLRGKNILVSAAAGSGKTAVLVERIKRLILEDRCPIDRMLIVTFTNAAAAEMKEKIHKAIHKSIEELTAGELTAEKKEDLKFLKQQLNLLPMAQISTFHAYALEVIRKYFYIIDAEPNFKICDEAQQTLLQEEAMETLLEECFEAEDPAFHHFLDCFSGDRNENKLKELVRQVYRTIQSLPEPYPWLHESVENLNRGNTESMVNFLKAVTAKSLADAESLGYINLGVVKDAKLAEAESLMLDDLKQIADLRRVMEEATYVELREALRCFKLGTLRKTYFAGKNSSLTPEEAEAMKNAVSRRRDDIKAKVKELRDNLLSQSQSEMIRDLEETYENAKMVEKLVLRYGELYEAEKKRKNLVDFNDIEHFAYKILKDRAVSDFYREKFLHIFVDEYQDSNVMQEALLARISRENNLFLVGDVKQSIYKFRLAEPEIFQKRYKEYSREEEEHSVKIDLNKNFRSKEPIVDFVNEVFDAIMDDYDENAALHLGDPHGRQAYHRPTLHLVQVAWEEDADIDDELKNIMKAEKEAMAAAKLIQNSLGKPYFDSKAGVERKLTLKDIVILLRGVRGYGDIFYNVLMENGLPAYVDDNEGYFDTMEINCFLSLIKILDNEKQDVPLLTILRSEIFDFSIEELAQIRMNCKEGSYYDAFMVYGENEDDLGKKVTSAIASLRLWQDWAVFMPLEELVWKLMLETGYYVAMGALPGGRQRQANLRALVDKAQSYGKSQGGSLYGFIGYIEAVKEKKVAGGQVKLVGEGDDLVKIMTIHKSKGLEFPMVILAGYCKKLNYTTLGKSLAIHKDLGIALPVVNPKEGWYRTTTLQKMIKHKIHQEEVEEEKRILYVALTRAKDRLAILGICNDVQKDLDAVGQDGSKNSSYFEMTGNRICTRLGYYDMVQDIELAHLTSKHQKKTEQVLKLFDEEKHVGNAELEEQIARQMTFTYPENRELLVKSKYSVSELNSRAATSKAPGASLEEVSEKKRFPIESLEEPASFKVRSSFTSVQRGTIYHCLLEHLDFRNAYSFGDAEKGREEIVETCNWLVEKQFLTREEADIIDPDIIVKLTSSDLGRRMAEAPTLYREQPFNLKMEYDATGDGNTSEVLVQGVMDCFFEEEDGLVLIDYKTSRIGKQKNGMPLSSGDFALEKARIASHYKMQMDIYRKALEVTTGLTVKESYIYLTDCGEVVPM